MIGILSFTGAIFIITLAHMVRVIRWEMFIKVYERPERANLIKATACGYLANCFVVFKLGDLLRAYVAGRKMKNGKSLGFSTVIVDRYLDILSVGLIFVILSLCNVSENVTWDMAAVYIILAVSLLALALIIFYFRGYVKKILILFASIFNKRIEISFLQFSWALIWNFKDIFQKLNKVKLLFLTVLMWASYICSYILFGVFLSSLGNQISWIDVFVLLFAQNGLKESAISNTVLNMEMAQYTFYISMYMLVPLTILLIISAIKCKTSSADDTNEDYLRLLPHVDERDRLKFLENYFSNNNRDYVGYYLKIIQNISIIRDLSAGSNATTMLCMDENNTFYRKYAFGDSGEKLFQQIQWIKDNSDKLVLPFILRQEKTDLYCYYDMPYNPNAVGFFEYAHSMPSESVWIMMKKVLYSLEKSIYKIDVRQAGYESIREYIASKVTKNLTKIKEGRYISRLLKYDEIIINGVEYKNLGYYEKYLTEEYLSNVFNKDDYAVIHGDLTIENIICTRDSDGKDGFYIIDPNTGNIHNSPNLDYAKLLQSIHGGYEFLVATKDVKITENRVDFLFTRSSAYKELHTRLNAYLLEKFGIERTRSIYFHEIIHWLRLVPYKIEKDDRNSVLFFAGMLMVMHDVITNFEN